MEPTREHQHRDIRPYQDGDELEVVGVWFRSGQSAHRTQAWQSLTFELAGEVFRKEILPSCDIWVGTREKQIVAYMAMKGSYIDRLYADPSEWRHGWGTRFLDFAKGLNPEGLELHTNLDNHAACRLYEKHGFKAVKYGVSPPPESLPDVEYHWRPNAIVLNN
jgi:GNAT superfamily N-acetyltransferase